MRFLHFLVAVVGAAICCVAPAGQSPADAGPAWRSAGAYVSHRWEQDGDQVYLIQGGRHVGSWSISGQYFLAVHGRDWAPAPSAPPVPVPACFVGLPDQAADAVAIGVKKDGVKNFGVVTAEVPGGASIKLHSAAHPAGIAVSADEAKKLLTEGVPDDRSKPWIVVVGSEAKTKAVVEDAAKDKDVSATFRVWAGQPGDWQLGDTETKAPYGYFTDVDPCLHLLAPTGEMLAVCKGYKGPADLQAFVRFLEKHEPAPLEAIRKVKTVDPKKVPDVNKPAPSPDGGPCLSPSCLWHSNQVYVGSALASLMYAYRRKLAGLPD